MTLKEFFDLLGQMPSLVLGFYLSIPLTAFLAGILGRNEGHLSPWKYLYSFLVYASAIPGIFAIALNVYLFLFERGSSILDADVYSRILPVLSMFLTFFLIRRNVDFDQIPGFEKLGGLVTIIGIALIMMWFLDKTRIIVFSYMPIQYLLLILVVLVLAMRWAVKSLFQGNRMS